MIIERPKHKAFVLLLAVVVMAFAVGSTFTSAADAKAAPTVPASPVLQETASDTTEEAAEETKPEIKVIPEQETLRFCWPVEKPHERMLTALYDGERHYGIDMSWNGCNGEKVLSACDGTVAMAVKGDMKYGNYLLIDHGNGVSTLYAHMSELSVDEDDKVKAGTVIGQIGSTGPSTGPHLHFEVICDGGTVNPISILPTLDSSEDLMYYRLEPSEGFQKPSSYILVERDDAKAN